MIALERLNHGSAEEFGAALASIFEHSPWVPARVAALRPFKSALSLHTALCEAVRGAEDALQLALIRSHPELAGRAASEGALTPASTSEQSRAGLSSLTQGQLSRLRQLNAQYAERFGFPFVLAVRGHTPETVIATLTRRLEQDAGEERSSALREIGRIALFRLMDLIEEPLGNAIIAMAEDLATLSEERDALTCSYLTPAHRATALRIRDFMMAAGLAARIDDVGNVVGVLEGGPDPKRVLTGSHYDTVINAGKYDGRLGILLPIAVAGSLRRARLTLPYPLEIIAFAEEEGVRFQSTFLGSRAVAGRFDARDLDRVDDAGTTLSAAMREAGHDVAAIPAIARDPRQVACFVEAHIEQGPVLLDADVPVGVVTRINGALRKLVTVQGLSGHAGTVPMARRRDAATAAAEMVLAVEQRCRDQPGLVGTVGKLEVPGGAVNVIPGRCQFSVDIRCESDALLDAAAADVDAAMAQIAARRHVDIDVRRVLETAGVPCATALQEAWAAAIERVTGRPALRLPSGAGHDAMIMANLTEIGMLFVRCGNGGISHHPDELLSAADAEIAAQVFRDFLLHFNGGSSVTAAPP